MNRLTAPAAPAPAETTATDGTGVDTALLYDGLITVDEQQRVVMVNAAATRMFACPAADMLGSELSRFIPARQRVAHAQQVHQLLQSDTVERHALTRKTIIGLRANGEEFLVEATITRMAAVDTLGGHRLATAQLRDLSDLSDLRNRMASFTERMRGIIDLAPLGVWIIDGDLIVYANKACAALFGVADHHALLGRWIYSLLRPESHAAVRHGLSLALGTEAPPPIISERIARFDGSTRDVEIAVAALPDHGPATLQMVISDVTDRLTLHRELQASRQELRRFTVGLVEAREAERRHIARELHDELAQRLTAMKMALATLPTAVGPDNPVAALLEMIDDTTAAVRRIAADLRPPMLDDLGLNAAVDWLVNGWALRMGLSVSLTLEPTDPRVGDSASTALYRILQEALTNVVRHAKANQVRVALHSGTGAVVLTVQDNGIGLPERATLQSGSHGLLGMRERCQMLDGQFEIGNLPGGGVGVTVRLPLTAEPPAQQPTGAPQRTPTKRT